MHVLTFILGPDGGHIAWWQESLRVLLIGAAGLTMIRVSGLRTFSRYSAMDTLVTVLIGSNLSRALTGNAPLWGTLAASFVLVAMHRLLAQATLASPTLAKWLKGSSRLLIEDGRIRPEHMRAEAISEGDLREAMRLRGIVDLGKVKTAMLERNGQISIHTD